MQQQDQSDKIETCENAATLAEAADVNGTAATFAEEIAANSATEQSTTEHTDEESASTPTRLPRGRFDWPALSAALALAAFFALTARFNSQPAPSYIPAAVFSATGCGLLVTAIRKLRARPGAGLLEAGLSGFGMALFQFAVAFTYPSVFSTITTVPDYGRAFLITWGLIALFAVVLSLAGATIGHLAFAPLRPLPARAQKQGNIDDDDDLDDEDDEALENENEEQSLELSITSPKSAHAQREPLATTEEPADEIAEHEEDNDEQTSATSPTIDDDDDEPADEELEEEEDENMLVAAAVAQPQRSLLNYTVTVLLLGLLPMMAGYVFAATYDFIMNAINVTTISPALYPTLSLLSGLLPFRLTAPINLSGPNSAFIVFTLLWRIPDSVLGNPNLFDVQALESLTFNAIGFALLLITMYGGHINGTGRRPAPWGIFLFLEALLGFILILPANLWLLRGLEGVLQIDGMFAQLPTIHLLNPALFVLNLITGMLFCLIIGLITRRQYQLWTAPKVKATPPTEEPD